VRWCADDEYRAVWAQPACRRDDNSQPGSVHELDTAGVDDKPHRTVIGDCRDDLVQQRGGEGIDLTVHRQHRRFALGVQRNFDVQRRVVARRGPPGRCRPRFQATDPAGPGVRCCRAPSTLRVRRWMASPPRSVPGASHLPLSTDPGMITPGHLRVPADDGWRAWRRTRGARTGTSRT